MIKALKAPRAIFRPKHVHVMIFILFLNVANSFIDSVILNVLGQWSVTLRGCADVLQGRGGDPNCGNLWSMAKHKTINTVNMAEH